eukprot:TRINITY_DN132_c0_g1_i1.p1 TRINITY_DN132_c0_g1~~TRINITY_DN132_c0_g1_i1.p1  ORF type:complete len:833 (+),score=422.17 TRINITY_DN132_c0_g1_i1:84-2582(+)
MLRAAFLLLALVLAVSAQTFTFAKSPFDAQPACTALLPDTLELTLAPTSVANIFSVTINRVGGAQLYTTVYTYDFSLTPDVIPAFTRTISLEGARQGEAFIFAQDQSNGGADTRLDFFIDTNSFRSADPSSLNFVENRVCMITYYSVDDVPAPATPADAASARVARAISTCVFNTTTAITYADASDCLKSVAFSEVQRTVTLDSLDILIDMYVYRDININSGGSDPVKVDLVKELKNMRTKTYSSNYDFHTDLRQLFIDARDIHTQYPLPICMSTFTFYQPFTLYSTIDDRTNEQVLTVSSNIVRNDALYNFAPGAFDGYIVKRINNVDAMTAYLDYVNNYLADKQEANRFNSGLGFGRKPFTSRRGVIPETASISWTLTNPITNDDIVVVAPWYASASLSYSSASDYATRCLSSNVSTACTAGISKREAPEPFHTRTLAELENGAVLSQFSRWYLTTFNTKTGVLVVPSFADANQSVEWLSQAFAVLYLESVHRYHFDELMVDVSGNGGGYIDAGLFLAGLIEKDVSNIPNTNDFDQIHSDFWDEAIEVYFDDFTVAQHENFTNFGLDDLFLRYPAGKDKLANPVKSWYTPGNSYTRGGATSKYSEKIELAYEYETALSEFLQTILDSQFYESYASEDILVITNGICYSTCSFFVRSLQLSSDPITVVGYGGIVGEALRSSDVPANVFPATFFNALGNLFQTLGYAQFAALTPQPFPFVDSCADTQGYHFQISLLESYEEGKDTPQEFTNSRVDVRLNIWPETAAEVWPLAAFEFIDNEQSTYISNPPATVSLPSVSLPSVSILNSSDSSSASALLSSVAVLMACLFALLF